MAFQATLKYTDLPRSGVALGGIGAGSLELRADGAFHRWSIFNNYPLGTGRRLSLDENSLLFFTVRYQEPGKPPRIKLLQIDTGYYVAGIHNHIYDFPWLSGVDCIHYRASFPFAHLTFTDPDMPFTIEMEAFSPFIPGDVKHSALPAVIFRFDVQASASVEVLLMASLRNGVGYDVTQKFYTTRLSESEAFRGVVMSCTGMDENASSFGSQGLYSLAPESSYYAGWGHRHPFYEIVLRNADLPNLDDTAARNAYHTGENQARAWEYLYSTLGISRSLKAGERLSHEFVTTWHFPNLYNASAPSQDVPGSRFEGHYYANFFADADESGRYVIDNLKSLEGRTRQFHTQFFDSTLDPALLDQMNSHLNTFVSSSWLTQAGDFGIQEGITSQQDWGPLATIDVALYGGIAAAALFPELDRAMLSAHQRLQRASGEISHGVPRDFSQFESHDREGGRVDLSAQYTLLALRHFLWTNDRAYLTEVWPSIKAALDFSLREHDRDGDSIPDMVGLGSSYDNFAMWGASAYVGSLWLAALQHAVIAAEVLGDTAAQETYAQVLEKARAGFEARLWTGQYYRLYNDEGGQHGGQDEGCMTDQLIGQWIAHQTGVGDVLPAERRQSALATIVGMAFEPGMGLRNCAWPDDAYLHDVPADCWFDQANTFWSGTELAFASYLIYEGFVEEALHIVRTVDERYRRNGRYFDHQEWGGHYYRPMAAWGILNALLGVSLHQGVVAFAPKLTDAQAKVFLAVPGATLHYQHDLPARAARLTLLTGELRAEVLHFTPPAGSDKLTFEGVRLAAGQTLDITW